MFPVDAPRVRIGSSELTPAELSARRLHSRVDLWRHRGGMSCACPGRLEMSRGSVEAKHVTSQQSESVKFMRHIHFRRLPWDPGVPPPFSCSDLPKIDVYEC